MDTLDTLIEQPNEYFFLCKICDYYTSRKLNYDRHKLSVKHKKNENDTKMIHLDHNVEQNEFFEQSEIFKCVCGKPYKYSQGLSKHKKICKYGVSETSQPTAYNGESDVKSLTNLILEVVKQNKELIEQNNGLTNKLVGMCGTAANNTQINNNLHNNSHNKTFNLNLFLNETCKNAMNIMDFVDSIQLQLSDLEDVGKVGFIEGITKIIIKNLKALDINKRPVHCADQKREVVYVKDEDKWEKENDQKINIRKAIKRVAFKNQKLLPQFKEAHPDCNYSDSKYADQYSKLVIESMGDNDEEKENKIIRNITREVLIDKSIN